MKEMYQNIMHSQTWSVISSPFLQGAIECHLYESENAEKLKMAYALTML